MLPKLIESFDKFNRERTSCYGEDILCSTIQLLSFSTVAILHFIFVKNQVDKSEDSKFSASQRRGRIYLQRFAGADGLERLELDQILETAAILDLKWSQVSVCWNTYLISFYKLSFWFGNLAVHLHKIFISPFDLCVFMPLIVSWFGSWSWEEKF